MPSADPVTEEVVRLYALPPDEFVAARNAAVKACKQEGRKDDAAAIAALRKPSVIESALNRTAHRDPDTTAAWAAAAQSADDAQSATIGGAEAGGLRAAVAELRAATAAMVDAAVVTIGDESKRDDIATLLRGVPVAAAHQVVNGVLGSAARSEDDLFAGAPNPPARPRPAKRATKERTTRASTPPTSPASGRTTTTESTVKPPAPKPPAPKPSARQRRLAATVERRRAALEALAVEREDARAAVDAAARRLDALERKHADAAAALADAEAELRADPVAGAD
jgi:hypothetical protein